MNGLILLLAVAIFMALGWVLMGGVDAFLTRVRQGFEREDMEEELPPAAVQERKAG